MFDAGPPPKIIFPRPAIIRPAKDLIRLDPLLIAAVAAHKLRRASGDAGVTIEWTDTDDTNTSTSASQTWTAKNIDGPGLIVAAFACNPSESSHTITSGTIGGVAATVGPERIEASSGNRNYSGMMWAVVPSGTTATVAATWNNTTRGAGLTLFRVRGYTDVTPATGTAGQTGSGTALNLNASMVAGSGVILATSSRGFSSYTWTNANETSDYQVAGGSGDITGSTAILTTPTNLGTVTFTATRAATDSRRTLVGAQWI